jgi:hypothetical protein
MNRPMRVSTLLAGALLLTACSVSTEPDQKALVYDAGAFSDTTYQECVNAGSRTWYGPGDKAFVYPNGQRTYAFDGEPHADHEPYTVPDKDGQPMTVVGVLNFTLNTDCKTLREFHERIGIKYGASEDGVTEWGRLLDTYLGTPLRNAMAEATQHYTWRELYLDGTKRDAWRDKVIEALPAQVKSLAEGDYFHAFTLVLPQPTPPQDLVAQLTQQQVNTERLNTINTQKAAQDAEIAQIEQLVKVFGPDGYILYRNQVNCEKNADSCIPFLPIPQGSSINVTPGG